MIKINLLPKEMRRPSGLGIPKSAVIGAAATVVILMVLAAVTAVQAYRVHAIDGKIAEVRRQAERMREDIVLVDRLVDVKTKVLSRLAAIETLDRGRERWVMILDELAGRVPDFLWLTAFRPATPTGAKSGINSPSAAVPTDTTAPAELLMSIEGYSFTLNGLANFLLELNSSDYFAQPQLNFAKLIEVEDQRAYNFSLSCRLEEPIAVDEVRDVENSEQDELDESSAVPGVASLLNDEQDH
jgi:Tfp pilus assembly protein PilN